MGAPRKSYEDKKHTTTVSLPGWLIIKLKEHGGKSKLIERLLIDYFGKIGK